MHLEQMLSQTYFHSYTYAYPHKTAYRLLAQPRKLDDVWKNEDTSVLFLYLHIPFCEMRCGFCNLFTTSLPEIDLVKTYLKQLKSEAEVAYVSCNSPNFARIEAGGGTPSFLNEDQLNFFFDILEQDLHISGVPFSFELSPSTVNPSKLQLLKARGVTRVSMGIQSIIDNEVKNLGRPQKNIDIDQAIRMIHDTGFERMNLDLIYGVRGQTEESWLQSLQFVVDSQTEEIYLYPLYVRPLTGLGKRNQQEEDFRLTLYRVGRDFLLERGYEQVSMRMFRQSTIGLQLGPAYSCQEDGMLGLGAGARSYTRKLHYSSEYAVGRKGIKEIIDGYINKSEDQLSWVNYGLALNQEEEQRRYVIMSLLDEDGLNVENFYRRFRQNLENCFPQLDQLRELNMLNPEKGRLKLNQKGIEVADTIGPWLYSLSVMKLSQEFDLR